jgi:elongation factor Tu
MPDDMLFHMTVEDVFSIRGRGTVVTGKIEQGVLNVGEVVELRGTYDTREIVVIAIELFRKKVEQARPGDYVGLVLGDVAKDEVSMGDELVGIEGG